MHTRPRFVSPAVVLVLCAGLAQTAALGRTGEPATQIGAGAGSRTAQPATLDGSDLLPIRKITLYRSGVGAFERQGSVDGSAKVQLKFDVSQINDIIKSLQLLDLSGGQIESVSYPSKDPLAKRLGSFSVPVADNLSIGDLLSRLRGSAIEIRTHEGPITGTILSVESRKQSAGPDQPPIDVPHVNLLTEVGIRSVNIVTIINFQLKDPRLSEDLNRALAAVADARTDRVKTIDLSLHGEGSRRIVARYVHETPVWKTSYRLVMSDAPDQKQDGKAVPSTFTLQGWAIVENTTDTDWKDVKLSLVSGRPVSFVMDLSEPLYLARPTLPVPTIPGVLPRNYESGTLAPAEPEAEKEALGWSDARRSLRAPGSPPPPSAAPRSAGHPGGRDASGAAMYGDIPITGDDLLKYSPAAQARAGEVGEVFFYEVQNPITIERQRSAMIPFLGSNIEGRRVSIYSSADRPDHPMRGVEIKNTSDLQLLPGPLAVFDGAAYAGDATINQVSPGDKRLLAYALDLDVAVTTQPTASGEITKIRLVQGMIEQTTKQVDALTYTFANKDQKRSRTIIVEHPRNAGWELKEPTKPADLTQALYRFEVAIEPAKQGTLAVRQEFISSQRLDVTSFDMPTILRLQQQGKASKAVLDAFQKLAGLQAAVAEVQRQLNDLQKQIGTNTTEQTRISETMQRLPQTSEVYADYMKELKELNTTLKTLRQRAGEKQAEVVTKTAERNEFVRGLNVE